MTQRLQIAAIAGAMLAIVCCGPPAIAQKSGGVLKVSFFDNPASMSLHEEVTGAALRPMMGVFNNLVMYDQHVAQNSPDSIMPGDELGLERGRQRTDFPVAPGRRMA
jgi:peptide/nickel transport system substrate-binding protein